MSYDDIPDEDGCEVHGCFDDGVNLIILEVTGVDGERGEAEALRCRKHTSKWDRLIVGPGPS